MAFRDLSKRVYLSYRARLIRSCTSEREGPINNSDIDNRGRFLFGP